MARYNIYNIYRKSDELEVTFNVWIYREAFHRQRCEDEKISKSAVVEMLSVAEWVFRWWESHLDSPNVWVSSLEGIKEVVSSSYALGGIHLTSSNNLCYKTLFLDFLFI